IEDYDLRDLHVPPPPVASARRLGLRAVRATRWPEKTAPRTPGGRRHVLPPRVRPYRARLLNGRSNPKARAMAYSRRFAAVSEPAPSGRGAGRSRPRRRRRRRRASRPRPGRGVRRARRALTGRGDTPVRFRDVGGDLRAYAIGRSGLKSGRGRFSANRPRGTSRRRAVLILRKLNRDL